ncbi:hypothetical protein EWM64_g8460 [Hericium alpestre]|uniref:phosphoribosylaminoimidazole carboxylase n=1 Tax=Hericium alpestre TaxID=135208 RepID=A0A4Y9ZNZ1_9AGAM|nr:hypothetical protein EWM64_g8460 [Hericium alpestre]
MATDTAFPIDVAQIVALFLESLFYGFYLVTFGMCMYALLSLGRKNGYRRWPLIVVALLLFTFATLDVAFLLRHVLDAFIWYKGPGGAIGELSNISYWVNVMKTVDYVAQTSIADGMLIYRCYIIYGRSWKIAAGLSVIWVAGMICEAFTCYIEFTLHTDTLLNAARLTPFITSTLTITLVLNLIATSMIVYKIWSLQRRDRLRVTSPAPLVGIVMRSDSDLPSCSARRGSSTASRAHDQRTPDRLVEYARSADDYGGRGRRTSRAVRPMVSLAVSYHANAGTLLTCAALCGVHVLQRGIPVAVVDIKTGINAGLLVVPILTVGIPWLVANMEACIKSLKTDVPRKMQMLEEIGWDDPEVKKS